MESAFCDRCGESGQYTLMLTRFRVGGDRYWLCAECRDAVVSLWLIEHQTLIARQRSQRMQSENEVSA